MAISINFVSIIVNSQNQNTTISVGENSQPGWDTQTKSNNGNGQYYGNSLSPFNVANINDNDVVDMPVSDNDFTPSTQNQQL
ncbi:hypothetical protein ACFSCX_12210 [Bacillus salitolerans]|uniref:Spore germination protein n=1 Tax=Bacillus salitolerans TaxID=1437434 RepID=A0ABW4LRK0_9BACI